MASQLENLRRHSVIVADSGDIDAIAKYRPQDATTNPSLILKAVQQERYRRIIDAAVAAVPTGGPTDRVAAITDQLFVAFGREILKLIPGRVSTEVEAALSFDQAASERKARALVELYEKAGVPRDRVLIKLASTWEGIRAAERLER
jgi:transaldolase